MAIVANVKVALSLYGMHLHPWSKWIGRKSTSATHYRPLIVGTTPVCPRSPQFMQLGAFGRVSGSSLSSIQSKRTDRVPCYGKSDVLCVSLKQSLKISLTEPCKHFGSRIESARQPRGLENACVELLMTCSK